VTFYNNRFVKGINIPGCNPFTTTAGMVNNCLEQWYYLNGATAALLSYVTVYSQPNMPAPPIPASNYYFYDNSNCECKPTFNNSILLDWNTWDSTNLTVFGVTVTPPTPGPTGCQITIIPPTDGGPSGSPSYTIPCPPTTLGTNSYEQYSVNIIRRIPTAGQPGLNAACNVPFASLNQAQACWVSYVTVNQPGCESLGTIYSESENYVIFSPNGGGTPLEPNWEVFTGLGPCSCNLPDGWYIDLEEYNPSGCASGAGCTSNCGGSAYAIQIIGCNIKGRTRIVGW
jgi:hypothetical protein